MKNITNTIYFSALSLFSLVICSSCEDNNLKDEAINKTEKIKKFPHDFMFMQRAFPSGEIKTEAYKNAIAFKKQRNNAVGDAWEFVGPLNIGGRITDIEIPLDQPQTYYVGAASGGVFKTTNAGANWQPIFDDQEMLSIGDIAISSNNSNLIWVGTGEVNAGGGSLAYDGDGIYKSIDGGATWEIKGLPDIGSISKIVIDPNDDNTLWVGGMGPLFKNNNNRGVYKTTDGGDTWQQKLFISDSTGIIDMAIHPTNGNILYAASWERIRRPQFRQYGGATSGIHKSTDGGETWVELSNGLPTIPSQKGRISIAIAPSNPNVLYARYANASGSIQGVYRSDDGGDTWTTRNSSSLQNVGFHWWFRGIVIDPTDEDVIYNVDFIVQKSTDGGNTWFTAFPGVHVDQHALAFNNGVPGEVLLGNDGGLYKSNDDGISSIKDETLPITQFYRMYVNQNNPESIIGGTQDNSTPRTLDGGLNNWEILYGGDGFQPLIDPSNSNTIYALSQFGNIGKSINNGVSFFGATSGISSGDRKNWDTPLVFDPLNPQILYTGTQRVYKTTNGAASWSAISPDLTNGPGGGNLSFGTIISIDVSPLDTNQIIVGTDDGNVWITLDGGANWNSVSSSLPVRWVTKVLASPVSPNTFYVTFSGYRYGFNEGHVYRTSNNGASWTDIGTSLPDIPVNDIVQDGEGSLYVATDVGVFASGNQGGVWQPLSNNMPSVVVTDLYIHQLSESLFAATYGRSIYKTNLAGLILNTTSVAPLSFIIYPNPATKQVSIAVNQTNGDTSIKLYNMLGQLVLQQPFSDLITTLDINQLKAGIYFVVLENATQKMSKKLVIK